MTRIVMWSGPRNLSTAMMRSFGQRAATDVVDEPFYAAYLAASGSPHPMAQAIMAAMPVDPTNVAAAMAMAPAAGRARYEKHLTHQLLPAFPLDWMDGARIAFLIRDPADVAASYARKRETCTPADIGVERQAELHDWCTARYGAPPIIDAADLLANPEAGLRALCVALDLPFEPAMLSWPSGRRESDGVWAPHWYAAVEASTGFGTPPDRTPPSGDAAAAAAATRPAYERLHARRLQF